MSMQKVLGNNALLICAPQIIIRKIWRMLCSTYPLEIHSTYYHTNNSKTS